MVQSQTEHGTLECEKKSAFLSSEVHPVLLSQIQIAEVSIQLESSIGDHLLRGHPYSKM